jgi:hypothetical protein
MGDPALRQRLDPGRRQIGYARWLIWLVALATPGFAVLLIAGTWSIVSTSKAEGWATAAWLVVLWVVFLGLLIVPGTWYLVRSWRDIPVLQLDAWGLVWGDDWSRDLAIEWQAVASITSRRVISRGYSGRWLLIHSRDDAIPTNTSTFVRLAAWLSREMYGTPNNIALETLRIDAEELLALIRRHYDGEVELAAIEKQKA